MCIKFTDPISKNVFIPTVHWISGGEAVLLDQKSEDQFWQLEFLPESIEFLNERGLVVNDSDIVAFLCLKYKT